MKFIANKHLRGKLVLVLILGLIILLAILIRSIFFSKIYPGKFKDIKEGRVCVWCKKAILEDDLTVNRSTGGSGVDETRFGLAHFRCEEDALERHESYYRAFLWLALVCSGILAVGVVSDLFDRHKIKWNDIGIYCCIFAACFSVPVLIGNCVKPWRKMIDDYKTKNVIPDKSSGT